MENIKAKKLVATKRSTFFLLVACIQMIGGVFFALSPEILGKWTTALLIGSSLFWFGLFLLQLCQNVVNVLKKE